MNGLIGWASGSSLISQRSDMKLVAVVVIVAVLSLVWVVGRMLWSAGKQGNAHYETVVDRLLRRPRSPWNRFDWRSVTRGT
jgi:hypothetical protein